MIEFQIHLKAAATAQDELERVLAHDFVSAVSRQPGFVRVEVLRSYDEQPGNPPALLAEGYRYQIVLTFVDEPHRQSWAASTDHERVFSRVKSLVEEVRGAGYEVLESDAASGTSR